MILGYKFIMTTTNLSTHRIALLRADGTYHGPGWVTFSGAGRTRKIEVEHIDGLGVLPRHGYTINFGEDTTGCEQMTIELRRAGWKVA